MAANSSAGILNRLAGLETEYAIRFHSADADVPPPPRFELFRRLLAALDQRIPGARASHFKEGVFLATGGAVWYESERTTVDAGLIEGSTPECRGPRQLLAYQRAQDQLLAAAAAAAAAEGDFSLLKNDRDAAGNVYGAQENYEAVIASGWRLVGWRLGLVILLVPALIAWLSLGLLILATFGYFLAAVLIVRTIESTRGTTPAWCRHLIATHWEDGRPKPNVAPAWLEQVLYYVTHVVTAPLTTALYLLCRGTAFAPQRRDLLAFLLSRSVIGGAGTVTTDGKFWLADKAPAVNCVNGFGSLLLRKPIFNFGHFLKLLCVEAPLAPREYGDLFRQRQRLQISLGDSNLAETAEYLRIGTTMLVLDASEARALSAPPRFPQPLAALRTWYSDPTLRAGVADRRGRVWTAWDVQRYYCDACRQFVDSHPHATAEARHLVDLWSETLDDLQGDRPSLVGRLDWVTKETLLTEAGLGASWDVLKKIDLRYHELTPDGYFARVAAAGHAVTLLEPDEIERATRTAPPDSPATTRGRYIREFARGDEPLAANWKQIIIGDGRRAKIVRLTRFGPTNDDA